MIVARRPALSLLSVALLSAAPAFCQDAASTFQQGVEQFRAGNQEEALKAFRNVLAMDLSKQDAYELWANTETDVWLDMLSAGGETELVAKRFGDLAKMGRSARSNDPDKIREAIAQALSEDVSTRIRGVRRLAANHGEYAVPQLVHSLADPNDADARVLTMRALTQMGDDVVLPLVAALDSPDAEMRRNVAYTLRYVDDRRAAPALALHAANDPEVAVRNAASQALQAMGASTDASAGFLKLGKAYYQQDGSVLLPHRYSDVVWSWTGAGLTATAVPRFLYPYELSKGAYAQALQADPGSLAARAGMARSIAAEKVALAQWQALGEDAGEWPERIARDELALRLAGSEALDLALGNALDGGDSGAALALCRTLGEDAGAATGNLQRALTQTDHGSVRGEAAVALASIAVRTGGTVSEAAIRALGEAASRSVQKIAVLIDGDPERSARLRAELEGENFFVNHWTSGLRALISLRQVPGVDVILLGDGLSDMTVDHVVFELGQDPRTAGTPLLVVAGDEVGDFGDAVEGVVADAGEVVGAVEAATGDGESYERILANDLARRSAAALHHLSIAGADVGQVSDALAGSLTGRPDEVLHTVLGTLSRVGGSQHVPAILAVLTDEGAGEGGRVDAAVALAGIFQRTGFADSDTMNQLQGVATEADSMAVRMAAARALGALNLTAEVRAELIRTVRAQ